MVDQLEQLHNLIANNQLNSAATLSEQLIASDPTEAEYYHLRGLIYAKQGNYQAAATQLLQAISLNNSAIYHSNISNAYKCMGNFSQARAHLQEAIRIDANYAEAYNNLASLNYREGLISSAVPLLEKAIRLNPNSWEAHYNLANCYTKLDKIVSAITHYKEVIKLNTNHEIAKQNLAMAYCMVNDFTNALPLLEHCARLNPDHSELQVQLAEAYIDLGKSSAAIEQLTKAIVLQPGRSELQHNLAVLYLQQGNYDKALNYFRKTVELQPENDTAKHMVIALSGGESSDHDNRKYVIDLFNQYAPYYDKHVKHNLKYQVPGLLRQQLQQNYDFSKQQNILDLGCGTGQCAAFFRDLAASLVGVDISLQMLMQASKLKAYDLLCQADVSQALPGMYKDFFHIVIAADLLVYIGDISVLFELVRKAIKSDGKFCMSFEIATGTNYKLQTNGRYAHNLDYIIDVAKSNNFIQDACEEVILRHQQQQPVKGYICSFTAQ